MSEEQKKAFESFREKAKRKKSISIFVFGQQR